MNELVDTCSQIIDSYIVLKERGNPKISELKTWIVFTGQFLFEYSEIIVTQPPKGKYSFQWMKADYQLLMRWNKALHHPYLATHPHHKHVDDEKNILASSEMTLEMALQEIEVRLSGQT